MGEDSRVLMVGYGTFITNETYKNSKDVKVCVVRGYRRLWLKSTFYPFVLPDPNYAGIHGLVFSISKDQLKNLDIYEGVEAGLYSREMLTVQTLDGSTTDAYIYIPTQKCINEFGLSLRKDPEDCWIEEIKKNPKIFERFPKLIQKVSKQ